MIKGFLTNKKLLLLTGFLIVACFLLLLVVWINVNDNTKSEDYNYSKVSPSPTPEDVIIKEQPYHDNSMLITEKDAESLRAPRLIGSLVKKLPHVEDSFSLYYSYTNDSFTLKLNKENSVQALADFEKFLNLNDLKKSDLENLKTEYQ